MSFANTKTPTKPTGPAKWQVPTRQGKRGTMEFYLEGELLTRFCKLFPIHSNIRIMEWFGISFSTLQRFKRELGLQKNMKAIRKELAKDVKEICENNGYYDSIRGKQPSEQCREAYRAWMAAGNHPMKSLKKKNYRKYKKVCEHRSEMRKEIERKERIRVDYGMPQLTNLHRPSTKFNHQQVCFRHNMMKRGYIMGDMREEMGERYVMFYDEQTTRSAICERNARNYGFQVRLLTD